MRPALEYSIISTSMIVRIWTALLLLNFIMGRRASR
jgi:hypothetical protein